MQKRYWLSYDLGVGGDYSSLYQWLDDHDAEPCGSGVASFVYEYPDTSDGDESLKNDLLGKVKTRPGNLLYIIRQRSGNRLTGSFIYGKRQAAPWTGYGSRTTQPDDE